MIFKNSTFANSLVIRRQSAKRDFSFYNKKAGAVASPRPNVLKTASKAKQIHFGASTITT